MSDHWVEIDPQRTVLVEAFRAAVLEGNINELIRHPADRPAGGIEVTLVCLVDGCQVPTHKIDLIGTWRLFAELEGQLRVWADLLPTHLRDQYGAARVDAEQVARAGLEGGPDGETS